MMADASNASELDQHQLNQLVENHINWSFPSKKGKKGSFCYNFLVYPRLLEVLSLPAGFCLFCHIYFSVF
jgi:hypothetical protein